MSVATYFGGHPLLDASHPWSFHHKVAGSVGDTSSTPALIMEGTYFTVFILIAHSYRFPFILFRLHSRNLMRRNDRFSAHVRMAVTVPKMRVHICDHEFERLGDGVSWQLIFRSKCAVEKDFSDMIYRDFNYRILL